MPPECILEYLNLPQQQHRIEHPVESFQPPALVGVEHIGREQPLHGGRCLVVDPPHPTPLPGLLLELHGGLEDVHVQAQRPVELGQLPIRRLPFKPVISHQLPDHRAVLLFDETLIVLLGDPSSGEGDVLLLTIGQQQIVDELAAIVSIQSQDGEWHKLGGVAKSVFDGMLGPMEQWQALDPAGRDVRENEGVQEGALGAVAAVGDQIGLEESRTSVISVGEGADRDLPFEQGSRFGGRHPSDAIPLPEGL